jgi:hypothetical protein
VLLALGPLQLDTTMRTVVIGVADSPDDACVDLATAGADAVWLRGAATVAQVRAAAERCARPIGVTVDDLDRAAELEAAGAAAVEVRSPDADADVAGLGSRPGLSLWCVPDVARRALDAGVAPERLIIEGGSWDGPGVVGATVVRDGPATWGSVVHALLEGAGAVRTTDARSVRRVVTVADRLLSARDGRT